MSLTKHFLALGIMVVLTLAVTWPMPLNVDAVKTNGGEEYLLSYLISWNVYALKNDLGNLYNPPFFYPFEKTLTYSEPLITPALIGLPLSFLGMEPYGLVNANLFLASVLGSFGLYVLVATITGSFWAGLLSGIAGGFSVGHWDSVSHLQLFSWYFMPFGWYFIYRKMIENWRWGDWLFWAGFSLQALISVFWGYAYLFTGLGLLLVLGWGKGSRQKFARFFLSGIPFIALLLLFFLPYLQVFSEFNETRSMDNIYGGSAYFLDYFYPTQSSRLRPLFDELFGKQPWPAYLGGGLSLGVLVAFWGLGLRRQKPSRILLAMGGISLVSVLLSFGPYFQLVRHTLKLPLPLPYWFMYHLIPGFKSMRVPQRWSQVALIGFSVFLGAALAELLKHKKHRRYIPWLSVVGSVIIVSELSFPFFSSPVPSVKQFPESYHWLKEQKNMKVIELPIQSWIMPGVSFEIEKLYYQSSVFSQKHRFVNGYSGFSPPSWLALVDSLQADPQEIVANISKQPIDTVIIYPLAYEQLKQKGYHTPPAQKIEAQFNQDSRWQLQEQTDESLIFSRIDEDKAKPKVGEAG